MVCLSTEVDYKNMPWRLDYSTNIGTLPSAYVSYICSCVLNRIPSTLDYVPQVLFFSM